MFPLSVNHLANASTKTKLIITRFRPISHLLFVVLFSVSMPFTWLSPEREPSTRSRSVIKSKLKWPFYPNDIILCGNDDVKHYWESYYETGKGKPYYLHAQLERGFKLCNIIQIKWMLLPWSTNLIALLLPAVTQVSYHFNVHWKPNK